MFNSIKIKNAFLNKMHKKPIVMDNKETIDKIINEGCSIARFGDGEFFLMTKEKGFEFQKINDSLSRRLFEVFNSNEKKLIVAIPKIFDDKDLDFRTKDSKKWWKKYLSTHRSLWYKYLDFNKIYGNTNFTRNYIAVENKSVCKEYFDYMKKIWDKKDIVLVEGKCSRLGVGNDLLDNAKSISRILAPNENAFDKYTYILDEVKKVSKDKMIFIALGPTATILAYDLCMLGYQAIDIGHVDIEYEWFLQGVTKKTKIGNKYTYEADGRIVQDDFKNEKYESQIISIIE